MDVTSLEDTVHTWVVAGSQLAADHVIWGGRGPAPAGPYIELALHDVQRVANDWIDPRLESGQVMYHVRGVRQVTLELTCIAADRYGEARPQAILDRVLTVELPSVAAVLRRAGVGIGARGPVRAIPGVRSGLFDPRAIAEVELYVASDLAERGSAIKRVSIATPGPLRPRS